MHTILIAIAIKLATTTSTPVMAAAQCSAPRHIGGGMTVRTCEVVRHAQ